MQRTYTRRELYDLVWSTPIVKVAEDFGFFDRGLAKLCQRHLIPVPGRGYWARIEAGQNVTKTPLRPMHSPELETVHLGTHKVQANPYVALAIEAANRTVKEFREQNTDIIEPRPKSSQNPIAHETPEDRLPNTLEPVKKPHFSISGLSSQLRETKPDGYGELRAPGIQIHPGSRTRVVAVLHHLALELDKRGIAISHDEKGIHATMIPDSVRFELTEERRRQKHEPTASELKREQEYERRRQLASRRGEWLSWERFWPEFDYIHEGKVGLEICCWSDGARKRWKDGKRQTLEEMIEQIADGILYHLAYQKQRRLDQEETERRRRHMAHRRELHRQRQEREEKRIAFLQALADFQREAADLRATISAAAASILPTPEYQRMIDWATKRLAMLEAQNSMDVLSANLREMKLFPETDTLEDPEGDPPPKQGYWDN